MPTPSTPRPQPTNQLQTQPQALTQDPWARPPQPQVSQGDDEMKKQQRNKNLAIIIVFVVIGLGVGYFVVTQNPGNIFGSSGTSGAGTGGNQSLPPQAYCANAASACQALGTNSTLCQQQCQACPENLRAACQAGDVNTVLQAPI